MSIPQEHAAIVTDLEAMLERLPERFTASRVLLTTARDALGQPANITLVAAHAMAAAIIDLESRVVALEDAAGDD